MAKKDTPKSNIEFEIVKLVKSRRDELGITQTKISEFLKVTRGYIGQIEMKSSASMYSFDQLKVLATVLKCSMKDFMPEKQVEKSRGEEY